LIIKVKSGEISKKDLFRFKLSHHHFGVYDNSRNPDFFIILIKEYYSTIGGRQHDYESGALCMVAHDAVLRLQAATLAFHE
jgi:hypothetical protein